MTRTLMADFDYELPPHLIAQEPLADRSASRLLVLDRTTGQIGHRHFTDLPDLLDPGDLVVVNDSRVIPARLIGRRESGGEVEFLLLRNLDGNRWQALIRPMRRLKVDEVVSFSDLAGGLRQSAARLVEKGDEGLGVVELDDDLARHLEAYGRVPLPPYIHHQLDEQERYQTVYADQPGSAAAPTAGLHFTPEMFSRLQEHGISRAEVTLHVGLDTFRPVSVDVAEDHQIHSEWCSVPQATAEAIARTKASGNRVVAVGTTSARTLETYGQFLAQDGAGSFSGPTRIYITPGYQWQVVDAMVTNFHLPKSTLLLMISSFAGREHVLNAYREAIAQEYRFFSFGDATLLINR